MISAFRIDPVASGRRLCDIDKVTDYSELLSHVSENGKSCQSENIPIILEIKKNKLSVYFRCARTSQFFDT